METKNRHLQLDNKHPFELLVADLHVPDGRFVPIVDHLLEPQALVKHPHDDQSALVARGELRIRRIPGNANLVSFLFGFDTAALQVHVMYTPAGEQAPLGPCERRKLEQKNGDHVQHRPLEAARDASVGCVSEL